MPEKIAGIGDEAVVNATGKSWTYWIECLDERDGTEIDHKGRVAALEAAGVESGWWQQQLAVGYEHERGLRKVGETADAGYQVGAQQTLYVDRERLWNLLIGDDVDLWLGETDSFAVEPGTTYETSDGTVGEIRTVSDSERVRLTWQPADRDATTTLQLTLSSSSDEAKTVLRIHHEQLADAAEREAMGERWRTALDRIESALDPTDEGY